MKSVRVNIEFSPIFKKRLKKLNPQALNKLPKLFKIFRINPFNAKLKTHKLRGKLKNTYAFYITPNIRIIFKFLNKSTVVFIDIGTHNQVYR